MDSFRSNSLIYFRELALFCQKYPFIMKDRKFFYRLFLFNFLFLAWQHADSQADYFPAEAGRRWKFQNVYQGDSLGIVTIDIVSAQNNKTSNIKKYDLKYHQQLIDPWGEALLYYDIFNDSAQPNDIFTQDVNTGIYRKTLKHRYRDGETWTVPESAPGIGDSLYTAQYIGNVSVPAGNFDSCFFVFRTHLGDTIGWVMAPDIGFVMETRSGIVNLVLTEYKKPPGIPLASDLKGLLDEVDVPYGVDSLGGIYAANQLIVQFRPGASDSVKDSIRGSVQIDIDSIKVCSCNPDLELWFFDHKVSDVIENKIKVEASTETEDTGLNYFTYDREKEIEVVESPFPVEGSANSGALTIAILDTGFDPNWQGLSLGAQDYLYTPGSIYGSNLIAQDNNIFDDHINKHGTRVFNKIVSILDQYPEGKDVKVLMLKTHNRSGVGLVFDAACGIYIAMNFNAKIINASWGWYGGSSPILEEAIEAAYIQDCALFMTGAGNDSTNLDFKPFYPATYSLESILVAGALSNDRTLAPFSNYSTLHVDIGCEGIEGTSFAAPLLAAYVALFYNRDRENCQTVRVNILDCVNQDLKLMNFISNGRFLNPYLPCLTTLPAPCNEDFSIFPNPIVDELLLTAQKDFPGEILIEVRDLSGKLVHQKKVYNYLKGNIEVLEMREFISGLYSLNIIQHGLILTSCKFFKAR